jgi:hypothetical protein
MFAPNGYENMAIKKKSLIGAGSAKAKEADGAAGKKAGSKPVEPAKLAAAKKLAMAKLATAKLSTARLTFLK